MSWEASAYIAVNQSWASIEDPSTTIRIEGSRSNRWLTLTDRGDIVEMTGAHIRSAYRLASDQRVARAC